MAGPHPSYGAAVTEVEMDVLTGEHVILRSDLLYQQPRSVNPVIDLGQIQVQHPTRRPTVSIACAS